MGIYILKRILLMVPTFFVVSFVVFVVLNFAPGNPAATALAAGDGAGGAQSSELSGQKRESYRLFKEQFNLDKPVLVNTRFGLGSDRVGEALRDILNLDGEVTQARQIAAAEDIENWGYYAIPGLIEILTTDPEPRVRAFASQRLAINGQRRLFVPSTGQPTAEQRTKNKEIATENGRIVQWRFGGDAPSAKQQEVTSAWTGWFEENKDRWEYGSSDKMRILLFDTRFAKYWSNLVRLDFGVSHVDKQPVIKTIFRKLKYSITLSLSAVFLIYLVSVPLGIWSAVNRGSTLDRILTVVLLMLYSLPTFFVGVFLLNLLSRGTPYQIFPTGGFESLDTSNMTTLEYIADVGWHVAMPIFCLGYGSLAALSRYARTGLLDVIRADYIRTARAKGLPEMIVILKHATRNGLIPILTLLATLLPYLIGGSVIVEVVFNVPGMGRFMFESIQIRDYNAVMAILLISCSLTLIGLLITDLSYALVDPRITFD